MSPTQSTSLSSSVNLINNVVGAGLFSMPWCLAQSTVVTGLALFVAVCVLNAYSFVLLARCCTLTGCYSYLEIGRRAFGPRFGVVAQATALLYACGSLISYIVLANNFLLGSGTGVLALAAQGHSEFLVRGEVLARMAVGFAFSALFFLPLSLLRSLDSLKLTSWLALAATLYAGFITVYELAAAPESSLTPAEKAAGRESMRSSVEYAGFPLGAFAALPIINVAFTAHYNAPRYFLELSRRSVARFGAVCAAALAVSLLVYASVGVCGYLSFGDLTAGDVLENFADAYPLAVGARGALLVVLASCYPKVQHSVRDGLLRLCRGLTTDSAPTNELVGCTLVVVGMSTLVGTLLHQVEVVLAYKGAVFGSLMVYVWPALMHAALTMQLPGGAAGGGGGGGSGEKPLLADDALMLGQPHDVMNGHVDDAQFLAAAGAAGAAALNSQELKPQRLGTVLCAMLTTTNHLGPTLLLVWGVVTGCLGVGVTIHKQL